MTVGKICICGQLVMPSDQHRCGPLRARDSVRHARQSLHGRATSRWQSLRKRALERDGHVCQLQMDAGCTGVATSVHLRPELEGNHDIATLNDVTSCCAHCHGVVDGGRARGGGPLARTRPRPAPRAARISSTRNVHDPDNKALGVFWWAKVQK